MAWARRTRPHAPPARPLWLALVLLGIPISPLRVTAVRCWSRERYWQMAWWLGMGPHTPARARARCPHTPARGPHDPLALVLLGIPIPSHRVAAARRRSHIICVCVCRCSVPEGRSSLVISPRRRREGGSPHATTGGSQSTGELTTKGEHPISHTRGRDPAGSLSPQYKSGHVGRDRGSLPY